MADLSRKHHSSPSTASIAYSSRRLLAIVIAVIGSTCLFHSTPVSAQGDLFTRDQLYTSNGLVQKWVAPMPTAPIASSSATNVGASGDKYVLQNWSTIHKTISVGSQDISFVPDPFVADGGQVMQLSYPKGSFAPSMGPVVGGAQFFAKPFGDKTAFEKMMVSYDVGFPNGFDWVHGGKLPGIYGGTPNDGCSGGIQSNGGDCLTMRLMWRDGGAGEAYAYVPADGRSNFCKSPEVMCNDQYGKSIGRGQIFFTAGVWTRMDMVMTLNEPAWNQNGTLQVYLNGKQVISMDNVPYRSTGMVGFQGLMFSSFFGGSDATYATPVDTQVYFKNVQLSVGNPATLYEGPGSGAPTLRQLQRSMSETTVLALVTIAFMFILV